MKNTWSIFEPGLELEASKALIRNIYVMQFHVFFHQIKISDHISVYEYNIWIR